MSKEAMKLALEVMKNHGDVSVDEWIAAEKALREALADQPAQQALDKMAENARELGLDYEPAQQDPVAVDKRGSPCPEFWDWLPKAYNFEGLGNFTKYNMEVAFLAGMQITSPPAQRTWIGLTDEDIDYLCELAYENDEELILTVQAKLKEKNT